MALRTIKAATDASVHPAERILRICLMVSLVFHAVMILALQNAIPTYLAGEEFRVYRVELLRPPVDDLDLVEKPDTDISKPEESCGLKALLRGDSGHHFSWIRMTKGM